MVALPRTTTSSLNICLCRRPRGLFEGLVAIRGRRDDPGMSTQPVLFPVLLAADTDPLVRAVAAYLARFKDATRVHTESDLRAFLVWRRERGVDPLKASRAQIELYVRWMQEVRHFQPSTVSRRVSVVVGFYRTCVIDQVLPQSPADYVRRPNVPPESPTLGLSHLQFEALLSAARPRRTPTTSPW